MKRSTTHILTTHTGSLPRTRELQEVLRLREERRPFDQPAFDASVRVAVADVVQQQIAIGLNVINDGEQGRSQYAAYVKERLTGFDGERLIRARPRLGDADFPEYVATHQSSTAIPQPACTGPIAWREKEAIQQDIATLKAAVGTRQVEEVFMTAASPGVIANFLPNDYYPTEEAYLSALAEVMKDDYKAIVEAGFLLQVDCPDLAMTRVSQYGHLTVDRVQRCGGTTRRCAQRRARRPPAGAHAPAPVLGELRRATSPRRAVAGDFTPGAQGASGGPLVRRGESTPRP